jgi:hypothetical protein
MASTYSNLKIQLMATGENSGTWGNVTNDNLGIAIEQAITGSVDVTVSSNTTLTLTDTNAAQNARALRLNLGGSGGFDLTVPAIQKLYLINNGSLGAVVVKNASGSTVTVPTAKTMWVFSTGTGVVDAVTHLTSLTLGSALPIASGGTGSTSTTFANLQTNVTGTLPIANGGTGSTSTTYANLQSNVSGTLPVANGGTGATDAPTARANLGAGTGNGTVTSVNLTAGTAISVSGGPITSSGSITVNNTGVTSLSAGTGISLSGSTGGVTISATGGGTVTSVATGNGLSGGTITTSGTLTVACPTFNTVGSYAQGFVLSQDGNQPLNLGSGGTYAAGGGTRQFQSGGISFTGSGNYYVNNLSGTWRNMGGNMPGGTEGCLTLICRVS